MIIYNLYFNLLSEIIKGMKDLLIILLLYHLKEKERETFRQRDKKLREKLCGKDRI